jgi:hypothetical protein
MIFSCNAHGHLVATRGHPTLQTSATKNSSSNLPDNEFFFAIHTSPWFQPEQQPTLQTCATTKFFQQSTKHRQWSCKSSWI